MNNLDLFAVACDVRATALPPPPESVAAPPAELQLDLFEHTPVEQALRRIKLALMARDATTVRGELTQLRHDPRARLCAHRCTRLHGAVRRECRH